MEELISCLEFRDFVSLSRLLSPPRRRGFLPLLPLLLDAAAKYDSPPPPLSSLLAEIFPQEQTDFVAALSRLSIRDASALAPATKCPLGSSQASSSAEQASRDSPQQSFAFFASLFSPSGYPAAPSGLPHSTAQHAANVLSLFCEDVAAVLHGCQRSASLPRAWTPLLPLLLPLLLLRLSPERVRAAALKRRQTPSEDDASAKSGASPRGSNSSVSLPSSAGEGRKRGREDVKAEERDPVQRCASAANGARAAGVEPREAEAGSDEKKQIVEAAVSPPDQLKCRAALLEGVSIARHVKGKGLRMKHALAPPSASSSSSPPHAAVSSASERRPPAVPFSRTFFFLSPTSPCLSQLPLLAFALELLAVYWLRRAAHADFGRASRRQTDSRQPAQTGAETHAASADEECLAAWRHASNFARVQQLGLRPGDLLFAGAADDPRRTEERKQRDSQAAEAEGDAGGARLEAHAGERTRERDADLVRDTVLAAVVQPGNLERGLQVAELLIETVIAAFNAANPVAGASDSSSGGAPAASRLPPLFVFSFAQKVFSALRQAGAAFSQLLFLKLFDASIPLPRPVLPLSVLRLLSFPSVDKLHEAVRMQVFPLQSLVSPACSASSSATSSPTSSATSSASSSTWSSALSSASSAALPASLFASVLARLPGAPLPKAELLLLLCVLSYDHEEAQHLRFLRDSRVRLEAEKHRRKLEQEEEERRRAPGSVLAAAAGALAMDEERGKAKKDSEKTTAKFLKSRGKTASKSSPPPSVTSLTPSPTERSRRGSLSLPSASPSTSASSSTPGSSSSSSASSSSSSSSSSTSSSSAPPAAPAASSSFPSSPSTFFLGGGKFDLSSEKGRVASALHQFFVEALLPPSASSPGSVPLSAAAPTGEAALASTELSSLGPRSSAFPSLPFFLQSHPFHRCSRVWSLLAVAEMTGFLPVDALVLPLRRAYRASLPYAVFWALKLAALSSSSLASASDVFSAYLSTASSSVSAAPPPEIAALLITCESVLLRAPHAASYSAGPPASFLPLEAAADFRQRLALLLFSPLTQETLRPADPLLVKKSLIRLLPASLSQQPCLGSRAAAPVLFDFVLGALLEPGCEEDDGNDESGAEEEEEPGEEEGRRRSWARARAACERELELLVGGRGVWSRPRARSEAKRGDGEGGSDAKPPRALRGPEQGEPTGVLEGAAECEAARWVAPSASPRESGAKSQTQVATEASDSQRPSRLRSAFCASDAGGKWDPREEDFFAETPSCSLCLMLSFRLYRFLLRFARNAVDAALVHVPAAMLQSHGRLEGGDSHLLPFSSLQRWFQCVEILSQMLASLASPDPSHPFFTDAAPAGEEEQERFFLASPLDLPVFFRRLREHAFPSASEILGSATSADAADAGRKGLAVGGAQRGLLFFSGAVSGRGQYAGRGRHLARDAEARRRSSAGAALILYMVARLHVIPYFKARDAVYLAKLHSLPWRGLLEFCATEPIFSHWVLRFVQDAVAAALPEVLSLLTPRPADWREQLEPSLLSPLTLSNACKGEDLRFKQLFADVAVAPFTQNTWTAQRTRGLLAGSSSPSPAFSLAASLSSALPSPRPLGVSAAPSALDIFAFGRAHLRRLWVDLVEPSGAPSCGSGASSAAKPPPSEEEICLLLETWQFYASLEPSVACLCLALELIRLFLASPSSHSSSFAGDACSDAAGCGEADSAAAKRVSCAEISAQYFNVCQNVLNLLLRVPAAVLLRLFAFNLLPDALYFFLLKMEGYVFMGAPSLPGFPRARFDPEEILATQEASVLQVLIELCRLSLPRGGGSSAALPDSPHDVRRVGALFKEDCEGATRNCGVWELLCRLLDRQSTRRPHALQLLFSQGFPLDAVNPICRFLQHAQHLLPLAVAALRETAAAIWRLSEDQGEAGTLQTDKKASSYEHFVRLPAEPTSASVHPALAPLTAVDRCLFFFKCITCVACDLRDNEALKREAPETNPAFAAESANAVFLESVKRLGDRASEELCDLIRRAIPIVLPLYYLFPKLAVLVSAFLSRRKLLTGEMTAVSAVPHSSPLTVGAKRKAVRRRERGKHAEEEDDSEEDVADRAVCEAMFEQLESDLHRILQYDMQQKGASPSQGEEEI